MFGKTELTTLYSQAYKSWKVKGERETSHYGILRYDVTDI